MITEKIHQSWRSLVGFRPSLWRLYIARLRFMLFRTFSPITVPEGFTLTHPSELISYWYFFVQKEFEHPRWVKRFIKEHRPWVLDIGANYGMFSRYASHLNGGAFVVAFEPQKDLADYVQKNAAHKCWHIALSDHTGTATLKFCPGPSRTASITGSMYATCHAECTVNTEPLDGYQYSPFLVKIDVDGAETMVVRGGLKTLQSTPFIIIEALGQESLDELSHLLPNHKRTRLTEMDWLYALPDFTG